MGPDGAIVRVLMSHAKESTRLGKQQSKAGREVKTKDNKQKEEGVPCHVGYAAGRDR